MTSENSPQQLLTKYIEEKKYIYDSLLNFLENSEDRDHSFTLFKENLIKYESKWNHEEITQFLVILNDITSNHHRCPYFIQKVNDIIQHLQGKIEQILTDIEIFHIFRKNKILLYFLLENNIITFSNEMIQKITNNNELNEQKYFHFFYREIESLIDESQKNKVMRDFTSTGTDVFDNFNGKRSIGENETYICTLIREDSLDKFVTYTKKNKYPLQSKITPSIFETNSFLEDKQLTLIEYSAFFGSIQIFRFLEESDVELSPSVWLYAIHSQNFELIHLLESFKIKPPNNKYEECFFESIKCHHNDLANYFKKYLTDNNNEELLSNILHYHNFAFFPDEFHKELEFYYLCLYNYQELVDLFIKTREKYIKYIEVQTLNIL